MEPQTKLKARAFETHAQTALVVLITGLLGWIALTVQETTVVMARVDTRLTNVEREVIDNAEANTSDAVTFRDIEKRLAALETEVQGLRRELSNGNTR